MYRQATIHFFNYGGTLMQYFNAFWVGGFICLLCQLFIDKTKITPAKILVSLVVLGIVFTAFGLYQPIVDYAGAGATVPLSGFGYLMATGVKESVDQHGFIGCLLGGITAAAAGFDAAILFSFLAALVTNPKSKR
jgi:stage V sporulation protein AE